MSIYSNFENDDEYEQDKKRKAREKFKPLKDSFSVVFGVILFTTLLGVSSFSFIYWCLSVVIIHYALKSLIACVVAYSLLLLITPDTDFKKRVRGATPKMVIIVATISLIIGFKNYGAGALDDYFRDQKANIYITDSTILASKGIKTTTVEFTTLKRDGETWSTKKVFSADSSVIIKVSGHEVRFVGFYILKPGMYEKIINKDEKLTFEGVDDKASMVSVSY